jgi:rubrerythrin
MNEQIKPLLYEALETEIGGVQVYKMALRCAVNEDLKKEWQEYLEQTQKHEQIVRELLEKLALDPEVETPGRKVAEFVQTQYRHCKPILALGAGQDLVENAGAPLVLPSGEPDPGVLKFPDQSTEEALEKFIEAIATHRHFAREMDPPHV